MKDKDNSGAHALHLEGQLASATETCKQYEEAASDVKHEMYRLRRELEVFSSDKDKLEHALTIEKSEKERLKIILNEKEQEAKLQVRASCLESHADIWGHRM